MQQEQPIRRGTDHNGAIFSPCEKYRYALWRQWTTLGVVEPVYVAFIGLNPSTADETQDDPTVRRCIRFAKREGADGMYMLNLFAFRATDPHAMFAAADPVGPLNDAHLVDYVEASAKAIACWGVHGKHRDRDRHVAQLRRRSANARTRTVGEILYSFSLTKEGHPRHPLYLPGNAPLRLFVQRA